MAAYKMLSAYATCVVVSLVGALFSLVAYRLFTGAINTKGLQNDKVTGRASPARVQLLLLSIGGALYYLITVIDMVQSGNTVNLSLPVPPKELIGLVLGSNTVYITAKAAAVRQAANLLSSLR